MGRRAFLLRFLRDIMQIPVTNLRRGLSNFENSILEGFDKQYKSVMQVPTVRGVANVMINNVMEGLITARFGLYLSNDAKAKNVYYPKSEINPDKYS